MEAIVRNFDAAVLATIAALCYPALRWSTKLVNHKYSSWFVAAIVGLFGFLFFHSHSISHMILEQSPPLRRALAGQRFIEGGWPLVVADRKSGEILYYGYLNVAFKDGALAVWGDDWKPDGTYGQDFRAKQTYLDDEGTLHYWYEQADKQQRGYTFIKFFPLDAVAERQAGVFHDPVHPDVRFYARKMKDGESPRSQEERRLAAKAFYDQVKPRLPAMLKTPINIDWE